LKIKSTPITGRPGPGTAEQVVVVDEQAINDTIVETFESAIVSHGFKISDLRILYCEREMFDDEYEIECLESNLFLLKTYTFFSAVVTLFILFFCIQSLNYNSAKLFGNFFFNLNIKFSFLSIFFNFKQAKAKQLLSFTFRYFYQTKIKNV
jgi:hypothetical protein